MPSRIGTAPLSPAHRTNSRSPRFRSTASSSSPTSSGRTTRASSTARPSPIQPVVHVAQVRERDRQAEHGERDDLAEAGQRGVEPLDLALVRRAQVADQDPGDEDGQEAGAVERRWPRRRWRRRRAASAAGRGRRWAAASGASAARAGSRRPHRPRAPTTICERELRGPLPDGVPAAGARRPPAALPSPRCRPGRWRRTRPRAAVPDRPPTSRRPSTENTTAGSVGASATPRSRAGAPVEAEDEVREQRRRRPR